MKLQDQILQKQSCDAAYFPNPQWIYASPTDINEFPYRRFYRGRIDDANPTVYARTAGYAPLSPVLKEPPPAIVKADPQTCFQNACSTVLPCYRPSSSIFISP